MKNNDYSQETPEKIQQLIAEASPREAVTIFSGLTSREQLEAMGRALSLSQVLEVLNECQGHTTTKLSPLLVGLSYQVFEKILNSATPEQLEVLKHESTAEPVQHHLTVFIHAMVEEGDKSSNKLQTLSDEIERLDVSTLTFTKLEILQNTIQETGRSNHQTIDIISKALTLAWNSNNPEIIDKLTILKEGFLHQKTEEIGFLRPEKHSATGLYLLLENRLKSVYNSGGVEAAQNDESALEALAKLGLWYLEDYWNIGLLSSIKQKEQLSLNPDTHTAQECENYREQLLNKVQAKLSSYGLYTIKDFKKAQIYSKPMLKEFLIRGKKENGTL